MKRAMKRVLVLLLAASCLCSALSSTDTDGSSSSDAHLARTSGGDGTAFVPVWLDVVLNVVNTGRYTDAAAKSADQELAMLPNLVALKTSSGTNACLHCTKAQLITNQSTILSAVQSAFETVRSRCVDEPAKYGTRLVRWATSNAGPPLKEEEQRAVTSAAAAMAKTIRHLFDTAVCPTLARDTEASLSKLEAQTREADEDAGRPAGWSQRWGKLAGIWHIAHTSHSLTHSLTHSLARSLTHSFIHFAPFSRPRTHTTLKPRTRALRTRTTTPGLRRSHSITPRTRSPWSTPDAAPRG